MPTVKALSHIRHDNVDRSEGDTFDVSEEQARDLVEAGVATTDKVSQADGPVESDDSHSETRFKVDDSVYDTRITKSGSVQYLKDGKQIKAAEFTKAKEQAIDTPSEEQPQQ